MKMRSVVRDRYGPPNVLTVQEVFRPVPKDNEILIKIEASTVNRTDCGGLWGKPFIYRFFVGFPKPKHLATGSDFAGIIIAAGPSAKRFQKGDRVFGFDDNSLGSHAEFLVVSENKPILKIPDQVSFVEAAASLEGAHYAINFINKVKLRKDDRVLVNGATGAIGSAAVQILRHMGADITATCPPGYVERVQAMGAGRVIDYTAEDFTVSGKGSYDFIFDSVGKSSFGRCRHLLTPRGVYISSELGPHSENPLLALVTPFLGGRRVIFPLPTDIASSMELIHSLLQSGEFKPLIDREYPLEKVAEAFEYVASGQKIGNVILKP